MLAERGSFHDGEHSAQIARLAARSNDCLLLRELIPLMRYVLLDLGQLELPEIGDSARQNLATEVVRVLTRTPVAELTTAVRRIMVLSSERGEGHAADAIAGRLALALARRHGRPPRKLKVDSMASLVSETEQWNYPPGAGDLQRLLEEERELRESEQQMRHKEQQSRRTFLVSLLCRLDPETDEDSVANLSIDDLEQRVNDSLGG